MPEAARQYHQVAHSLGMAGLIGGMIVGGALAVGFVVITGGTGAVVIASAVATGVSAGGGLGKMVGSHFSGMPSGPITLNCVNTVLIEGFPAAAVASMAMCTGGMIGPPHPSSPIVQGSSTVLVGGRPAARKGDKLACSAVVNEGASTVIIGGETVTVGPLNPEIPGWVDWGLTGLGMLGGFGLLRAGGMGILAAATRVGGATAGGFGGSMLGGWGAEQFGYQPGSWGHDLASLGGGLLGGYGGYKGVDRAMPVPTGKSPMPVTTPEEPVFNQALRNTVEADAQRLAQLPKDERGPVVARAYDSKTGKTSEAYTNVDAVPDDLHPILQNRVQGLNENGKPHYSEPGTHAEVLATDELLKARQAAGETITERTLNEIVTDQYWLDTKTGRPNNGINPAPTCGNCTEILKGTHSQAGKK